MFALAVIFFSYKGYNIVFKRHIAADFDWRNSVGTVTFRFVLPCKDCGYPIERKLQQDRERYCSNCLRKPWAWALKTPTFFLSHISLYGRDMGPRWTLYLRRTARRPRRTATLHRALTATLHNTPRHLRRPPPWDAPPYEWEQNAAGPLYAARDALRLKQKKRDSKKDVVFFKDRTGLHCSTVLHCKTNSIACVAWLRLRSIDSKEPSDTADKGFLCLVYDLFDCIHGSHTACISHEGLDLTHHIVRIVERIDTLAVAPKVWTTYQHRIYILELSNFFVKFFVQFNSI